MTVSMLIKQLWRHPVLPLIYDGLTGTGITWDSTGAVSKTPKGMVIENGAYVGME